MGQPDKSWITTPGDQQRPRSAALPVGLRGLGVQGFNGLGVEGFRVQGLGFGGLGFRACTPRRRQDPNRDSGPNPEYPQ